MDATYRFHNEPELPAEPPFLPTLDSCVWPFFEKASLFGPFLKKARCV